MDGDLFNVQIDSYSENEEEDATLTDKEIAKFIEISILEDSEEGLWVTDIPDSVEIIVQGQGFVEDNQKVITNPQ